MCACFISRSCERPFRPFPQGSGLGSPAGHGRDPLFGFTHFPMSLYYGFHFSSRNPTIWRAASLHLTPHGHLSSHFRHLLGRRQPKKCGLSFSGLLLHARRQADRTEATRREVLCCRAGDCSDQAKNISSCTELNAPLLLSIVEFFRPFNICLFSTLSFLSGHPKRAQEEPLQFPPPAVCMFLPSAAGNLSPL